MTCIYTTDHAWTAAPVTLPLSCWGGYTVNSKHQRLKPQRLKQPTSERMFIIAVRSPVHILKTHDEKTKN